METTLTPFLSSLFILLREGFEAMLIAILVFMYLDKVQARDKRPAVVWGCLLYTSPSPRDATLSRMPSSA